MVLGRRRDDLSGLNGIGWPCVWRFGLDEGDGEIMRVLEYLGKDASSIYLLNIYAIWRAKVPFIYICADARPL